MTVSLLGIRHHGPGSARAVRAALRELEPDVVLVEGPPEADGLLKHLPGLVPPVALLAHQLDDPSRAAFWPYAVFSPEWQAFVHAHEYGVPLRFCDLPAANTLTQEPTEPAEPAVRTDPLGWLSRAAGHDDPERWWEDVVEHRLGGDPLELFAGIAEAMTALREQEPEQGPHDAAREAHMRTVVRATVKEGFSRIAVVCGAWHVPALAARSTAAADTAVLKGLPKARVATTWVPWTSRRLGYGTGYGAGVASPGWYAHLWGAPDAVAERWVSRAAALLRAADLPASPASAVETVRLAETLAAMRGRSLPGLCELDEALEAVLCEGNPAPLAVIRDRLEVGLQLGEVPDTVPTVPLQADLERTCTRLRMKPTAGDRDLELDLRKEMDLARSQLLHRLLLLRLPWGTLRVSRSTGTFREAWTLRWVPELSVSLIEASRHGTTVPAATAAVVRDRAESAVDLPSVTELVEAVVLADLPQALAAVTGALEQRSARTGDVGHLMAALPPLARVLRYGSVRRTDTDLVQGVVDSLFVRVVAGLPPACTSLDDDAAAALLRALEGAQEAVELIAAGDQVEAWRGALLAVADLHGAPGLLAGRCVRLLLDAHVLSGDDVGRRLSRALSVARAPADAVHWLEGLLRGSGVLLLRDGVLWELLDDWLTGLSAEHFEEVLPLLRRAFGDFPAPERRQMGERVRHGAPRGVAAPAAADWDAERVAVIVPVLAAVLGVDRG